MGIGQMVSLLGSDSIRNRPWEGTRCPGYVIGQDRKGSGSDEGAVTDRQYGATNVRWKAVDC